jgi:hypothetical protein
MPAGYLPFTTSHQQQGNDRASNRTVILYVRQLLRKAHITHDTVANGQVFEPRDGKLHSSELTLLLFTIAEINDIHANFVLAELYIYSQTSPNWPSF